MFLNQELDFDLIVDEPAELYMGALPTAWSQVPARIVVNLCGMYPSGDATGRIILSLPLFDVLDEEFVPDRDLFEAFLESVALHAENEASYWHCHAGINRSGLAVAGYLHRHLDMRISDAITLLRDQRSDMVLCNGAFERALREWYGDADEQEFEPFSHDSYRRGREPRY